MKYLLTREQRPAYLSAVFRSNQVSRVFSLALTLLALGALTGCVQVPPPASRSQINDLRLALTSLHPEILDREAAQMATLAFDYSRGLAGDYRLVRPPVLHNLLINVRLKRRGLCYHWAEDLAAKLQTLPLESLELHWGVARPGTWREHNTVVVTARDQPFTEGIVLDPWRRSGELWWRPVGADSYAWQEGEMSSPPPR